MSCNGKVFNIQRFCLHDGDGIRTTIFFSGCPLKCKWCQNPECYIKGENYTIKQIIKEILKDKRYFLQSGGGVTFSGGEVCLQADFATELAKVCLEQGISVFIETSGYCEQDKFIKLAKQCSKIYFDIKILDELEFEKWTGGNIQTVLSNLELLEKEGIKTVIRCPIIGGVNDNESHYKSIAELVKDFTVVERVDLLPYNYLCVSKYEKINKSFNYDLYIPNNLEQAKKIIQDISKKDVEIC
jgi:pyruvate formate lyase activating enzyme